MDALGELPQVKYMPIDTPERQNGWFVCAFSLDIEKMNCDISSSSRRRAPRAAPAGRSSGRSATRSGRSWSSAASAIRASPSRRRNTPTRRASTTATVEVPNARWHETHTFTCFAYPTFTEDDMQQIAAALVKVIKAYS